MKQKQISALVGVGLIAFSAVLCWPGDYGDPLGFYRAVFINVANLLITEIPKLKYKSLKVLQWCKIALVILGFILLAICLLNINDRTVIDCAEYIYFWIATGVCALSLINFWELMGKDTPKPPKATEVAEKVANMP